MRKIIAPALCLSVASVMTSISPATIAEAASANAPAGYKLFNQRCAACHSVDPNGKSGVGPTLRGVVGRKAGVLPGFTYSPSMKGSQIVWNAANLDKYLSGPAQVVPGTRMTISVVNPTDRQAIIAYLQGQH